MAYRRVRCSLQVLVDMMSEGAEEIHARLVGNKLPAGTHIAWVVQDTDQDRRSYPPLPVGDVWVVVGHDSFKNLPDSGEIPEHPSPVFQKILIEYPSRCATVQT